MQDTRAGALVFSTIWPDGSGLVSIASRLRARARMRQSRAWRRNVRVTRINLRGKSRERRPETRQPSNRSAIPGIRLRSACRSWAHQRGAMLAQLRCRLRSAAQSPRRPSRRVGKSDKDFSPLRVERFEIQQVHVITIPNLKPNLPCPTLCWAAR